MCGIFGYVTTKPNNRFANIMGQGLLVDTLRGSCGTGIYGFDKRKNEYHTYKKAIPGFDFLNSTQFEIFANNIMDLNVVIGHNRASTIGNARDSNCHPFVYGNIGLVHNGTLTGYTRLVDTGFTHPVDSAYAAKGMATKGEKETLENTEGAFVFVWHNMEKNTFNIARNNNRDIFWVTDKDDETLFFASEYLMLNWILARNGIDIGNHKFRNPSEYVWVSWDLSKGLKQPKMEKFEKYVYKYSGHNYGGNAYDYNGPGSRGEFKSRDEKELLELGFDMYEDLIVKIVSFDSYGQWENRRPNEDPFGAIIGEVTREGAKSDGMMVRVNGMRLSDYEKVIAAGKTCTVKVTGVSTHWGQDAAKDKKSLIGKIDMSRIPSAPAEGSKSETKTSDKTEDPERKYPTLREAAEQRNKDDAVDLIEAPKGTFQSKESILTILDGGCINCGDPLDFTQINRLTWLDWGGGEMKAVCEKCSNDRGVMKELREYGRICH